MRLGAGVCALGFAALQLWLCGLLQAALSTVPGSVPALVAGNRRKQNALAKRSWSAQCSPSPVGLPRLATELAFSLYSSA